LYATSWVSYHHPKPQELRFVFLDVASDVVAYWISVF